MRVLRSSGALLSHQFHADGVAQTADGTVTVAITKADGTALAGGSGNAALVVGPPASYTFSLPPQTTLNRLTVTWSGTFAGLPIVQTDEVEIVGGFYLAEVDLRALDSRFALTASPLISSADLRRVRDDVEDAIEAEAGVAFVSRFARETLDGSGRAGMLLGHMYPTAVRSLRAYSSATAYTSFTADELAAVTYASSGVIGSWSSSYAYGSRNLVVEYEHGLTFPPPLIRRAARALFKTWMLEDLASANNDLANVRSLSVEGYSRSFFEDVRSGNKTVDQLIDEWKRSTTPAGVAVA